MGRPHKTLSPVVAFVAGMYLLLLGIFLLSRLTILVRNTEVAAKVPYETLLQSFLVGMRFDLAVCSYLLIPLFLALVLCPGLKRGVVLSLFNLVVGSVLLLGLAEAEFYRQFESRYNSIVFEYASHPRIVAGMIWKGYPVIRYLLFWGLLIALYAAAFRYLRRRFLGSPAKGGVLHPRIQHVAVSAILLILMACVSRGGFAHDPLRWGDAFFSQYLFANHLAMNGVFALGSSAWDKVRGKPDIWVKALPEKDALETTRGMVMLADEKAVLPDTYPLLRRPQPSSPSVLLNTEGPSRPANVVIILMESFSARFVGALGSEAGLTPEFDRLCGEGILFERAFSNGTHTHQGVYASLTSFPNLPGYEYLMKMMEANQGLSDLPSRLKTRGYQTLFLYNGLFSWDNKEDFFRQHGIERFIGTEAFIDPSFVDPVWGVSDHDLFMRANEEFKAMAQKGPFFAAILTLSNHSPFNLPETLPFDRIETGGDMDPRFNGIRYADWALGEFFQRASKEDYFKNTLFVLTADHGFGHPPVITTMQLERFHVPLLFYSPDLLGTEGERRETVASHVDIVPSVLGLLAEGDAHQGWGRNLFSPHLKDAGFAVIKASANEPRVALIEGDYILVTAPRQRPWLCRFSLGSPPTSTANIYDQERKRAEGMEVRLKAYVETAILALRGHRLDVPKGLSVAGQRALAPRDGDGVERASNAQPPPHAW